MSLSHVEFVLGEQVLQTFVINIDFKSFIVQVMSPNFDSKDNGRQLKIMSGIVLFMGFNCMNHRLTLSHVA